MLSSKSVDRGEEIVLRDSSIWRPYSRGAAALKMGKTGGVPGGVPGYMAGKPRKGASQERRSAQVRAG